MKLSMCLFVLCWMLMGWSLGQAQEPAAPLQPVDAPPTAEVTELEVAKPAASEAAQQSDEAQPQNNAAPQKEAAPVDQLLERRYKQAMVIDVRGPIFGSLKSYLFNRLQVARDGDVDVIVLRVTSPGGSLEDSVEIARQLAAIDWATTIVYVPEEAYSGAAILALGCDRIYMHPRALIGDAGPIVNENGVFQHVEEKRVSAIAAMMHELAEIKNRPGALAEAMVDRKLSIYEATHKVSGQRTFLTNKEIE
ncbi:MAG: hypothetical protein IT423_04340, partial [Pirellulaceae bacterium]|nr:hypothetical protein [Pirellulaceae bacterium]